MLKPVDRSPVRSNLKLKLVPKLHPVWLQLLGQQSKVDLGLVPVWLLELPLLSLGESEVLWVLPEALAVPLVDSLAVLVVVPFSFKHFSWSYVK